MAVALVGSGPARDAVAAALGDVSAAVADVDPGGIGHADLAVVTGRSGDAAFGRADRTARDHDTPWIAVETGGLAGVPVVDAAVSGFAPETGCYQCLRTRVRSNTGGTDGSPADPAPGTARFAGAIAGREAVRLLSGEESPVVGGVRELPEARRRFLPVPDCACRDGRPDTRPTLTRVDRDLEAALASAEEALDDRVGIVSEVGEAESYPAPYYLAHLCDTSGFSDATASANAAGVDADWDAAFMKALGEALERYSAGVYRVDAFQTGPPDALEGTVPPGAFVRPDDPDDTPDREDVAWIPGSQLHSGDRALLPAEFVTFPPPAERFRPAVTTGLGLGNGGVEALSSGLYEVLERDAVMLAWYSTFEPLGVDVAAESFRTLVGRARAVDLSVSTVLVTQDVDVPVVAVAVHREEWPRFALGSAAHLDAARAATGALAEALQNWMELRGMGREAATSADGAIGEYAAFPDRVRPFVEPDGAVPAASLGPEDVPVGEAHLDAVLERVGDAGLTAYAARTTTRDLAALGFEAVRVVVPSAQPLFLDDAYFGDRAETVPATLGFEPRLDRQHHPFP